MSAKSKSKKSDVKSSYRTDYFDIKKIGLA